MGVATLPGGGRGYSDSMYHQYALTKLLLTHSFQFVPFYQFSLRVSRLPTHALLWQPCMHDTIAIRSLTHGYLSKA